MAFIKKYYLWFVLAIVIALWGYVYTVRANPCEQPLVYKLGTFDTRFGISKVDFLREVASAGSIWENAIGKDLFQTAGEVKVQTGLRLFLMQNVGKYFTRGSITINLVYDDRQKNADVQRSVISGIDETKQSADVIKAQFTKLQSSYDASKAEYQSMIADYKRNGGDRAAIEAKRLEVNALADQINELVHKYNYLVKTVNTTISEVNQTAGQEFEEGLYISDVKGERINIYEFGSRAVLRRVLAHELGHALGLEHNDNPNSIMYYLNSSKNSVPTAEDLSALRAICKGK